LSARAVLVERSALISSSPYIFPSRKSRISDLVGFEGKRWSTPLAAQTPWSSERERLVKRDE
jgi:hypothetical protein